MYEIDHRQRAQINLISLPPSVLLSRQEMSCDDDEAYFADEETGNSERVNGFTSSQSGGNKKTLKSYLSDFRCQGLPR